MAIEFNLLRPADLLCLHIEAVNMRLDPSQPDDPALAPDEPQRPSFLIYTFPPQTITEQAFFESSPLSPPPGEESKPFNPNPPPGSTPVPPVKSRLGGPSRLVFRFPAGAMFRIPFQVESLLNWESFEPNLTPLAAVPPAPTYEERQNAPDIQRPGRLETAIEMPYRLIISPNQAAAWRHPLQPVTHRGFTGLWHTRLVLKDEEGEIIELSRQQTAPLRAIWSPDFNADKFTADDPPKFGAPDSDMGVLTPMTPSDRHELVVLTSAFHGYVRDKDDLTSYIPQPFYAEKFMLSSLGAWLRSRGAWDPPAPFRSFLVVRQDGRTWKSYIDDLIRVRPLTGSHNPGREEIENPPVSGPPSEEPREGAAFSSESPVSGSEAVEQPQNLDITLPEAREMLFPDTSVILWPPLLGTTGDLLNISEWTHNATQGRDHYVRIVYEGHLYPFGHRASLIKVTERKIKDVPGPDGLFHTLAYLVQRMFIVVRKPLRDYASPEIKNHLEDEGRGLPLKAVRLTTVVTPDIANPEDGSLIPGSTYSFWVRLGDGNEPEDDFKFHAEAEDWNGHKIDFNASLIFVPFGEGHRDVVAAAYAASGEARACAVPGQKLSYAPANGASENTTLDTTALYFTTHSAPVNKEFGGFLPRLFKARVNLPAVEALLGAPAETQIAYADPYLNASPGNTTGLFARVVEEVSPGVLNAAQLVSEFSADQAGGFATPHLAISGLTSQLGPLAGDLTNAAADIFDPDNFFDEVRDAAKLFGTLSLADLLEPLTMSAGAPRVQLQKEVIATPPPNEKIKLITTLDWEPGLKELNLGIITFHPNKNGSSAKLEVHGRVEKVIEIPPSGAPDPGAAVMDGSLTNFRLELLHVVEVLFIRFAFHTETGKKLSVAVELDPSTPVRFMEDLQFVEELRKSIPPDLFGDGPSLDINASRVKAGFSLGLPPVAVGVFALRDITLGAFLELPFLDGKPTFDFSFSSRERPFNLTVMIFGGGGFFHLQIDTLGIKMLEAALEFGASASIDLGVASGGVYMMAGIYFSVQRRMIDGVEVDAATLAGYLRMGGELSVLGLISVSLEFYLVFSYEAAKNAASGRATLTVKVEVAFFSKSVEITVEKRFGGSSGDPTFLEAFDTPAVWDTYAGAFA
ncbi:MAG: hypothetical protein GX495_02785 [Chloroflexi bacterium]|nr:hypothetical protein [Chloroflexota bacterium]